MKKRKNKTHLEDIEFTVGSGNVYADFDLPNPGEAKTKAELAILITSVIKEKHLTQREAANRMGIDQPKVSKIMRGILAEFSIERLMGFLLRLGFDINLQATPHKTSLEPPAIHVIGKIFNKSGSSLRL
jgi:predicted XRE-type DNA-binding protein